MLTACLLLGLLALPFVVTVTLPSNRSVAEMPQSLLVGLLILWVVLLWCSGLAVAWPYAMTALQALGR
jgi:hypothetical protein